MKRAAVDIDYEIFRSLAALLESANLSILGSLDSSPLSPPGTIRLLIAGEALPAECEYSRNLVSLIVFQRTSNDGQVTRTIEEIRIIGPYVPADKSPSKVVA